MIIVAGSLRLRPEARDGALAAASTARAATLDEPGCRAYDFSVDIDDENLVHVREEWEDEASLAAHFTQPHLAAFLQATAEAVEGVPTFTKYVDVEGQPLFG